MTPTLDIGVARGDALREYERGNAKDEAARAERSGLWRAMSSLKARAATAMALTVEYEVYAVVDSRDQRQFVPDVPQLTAL